eukprot:GHVL01015983.1.p1 GENE.GHVL01015983.1~~GHVL01015983.1.p1  ORF type:complete len:438 (+),score=149.59 GHVL01015983.1:82-1314(+)
MRYFKKNNVGYNKDIYENNRNIYNIILFYTGNEGNLEMFYDNSGFVTETLANEFNALVIYAEHRYFGKTLPFGKDSFKNENIHFLSVEQTMSDYALFIRYLKDIYNIPVITVGGSYGGMLAAWMRYKYPNLVFAALAASAPIFLENTNEFEYNIQVENDYHLCSNDIKSDILYMNSTNIYNKIYNNFNLCNKIENKKDLNIFFNWIVDTLGSIAMTNYPQKSNFLFSLPGWPINKICKIMKKKLNKKIRLSEALRGVNVITDKCIDYIDKVDVDMKGWDYLACTSQNFKLGSNGHMFLPQIWNQTEVDLECEKKYSVKPDTEWAVTFTGNRQEWDENCSKIIFSNGEFDPWRSGGVLNITSSDCLALNIPQGAHHLDLRLPQDSDPQGVKNVRKIEIKTIHEWLNVNEDL